MTTTGRTTDDPTATAAEGALGMVHLRVDDADRAMRFFGDVFGWQSERVPLDGHVNHYVTNTNVTIRLVGDPAYEPVIPLYTVTDVDRAARAVESSGGVIHDSEIASDGGGWARGTDNQGVPLFVFRPGGYHQSGPTQPPIGQVGFVFVREDAGRATRFYQQVLGWRLQRSHPSSSYFETGTSVGVFDEAAAFGRPVTPSAFLYIEVPVLRPVLARVAELGGQAGDAAQDMGPYFSAVCEDDQGTPFGVVSLSLG